MHDIEGRLLYLRARYYSPEMMRFIQQDTVFGEIENPLTRNLYAYGNGNPLKYVDPSGHENKIRNNLDGGGGLENEVNGLNSYSFISSWGDRTLLEIIARNVKIEDMDK